MEQKPGEPYGVEKEISTPVPAWARSSKNATLSMTCVPTVSELSAKVAAPEAVIAVATPS